MAKPHLVYWDTRGFCEPIRYTLHYLKIDFEDKRLPLTPEGFAKWAEMKKESTLAFPNLPYYIDGDLKLSQNLAILKHLGRKHGIYGDCEKERATLDMVEQVIEEIKKAAWLLFYDKNFHQIKEELKKAIPEKLGEMERFMQGKKFILGEKLSCIDFFLYETTDWFRLFAPELFKTHPALKNLNGFLQRIEQIPEMKEYMGSDKYKNWPILGPAMNFGFSKDPKYKPTKMSYINWVAKYPLEKE